MLKRFKGSALLWAVCSLLLAVIIVTGLLMINKSYVEEEISETSHRQAEYYARSGVETTAVLLEENRLEVNITDKTDMTIGTVEYSWCKVEIYTDSCNEGVYRVLLKSTAEAADETETVLGVMKYESDTGKWSFDGYAAY